MEISKWNNIVKRLSNPHLLQTGEWAELKSRFGWKPLPVVWYENKGAYHLVHSDEVFQMEEEPAAAALVMKRSLPLGLSVLYTPKGPLLSDWADQTLRKRVLRDLREIAVQEQAIMLKIDPDVPCGRGKPGEEGATENPLGKDLISELRGGGWKFSSDQIQYRNTVLVDLKPTEDELLMNMKSKTRYNIRLAGRKGVEIRSGDQDDFDRLYTMYAKTSVRGGFTIRDEKYYRYLWNLFLPAESDQRKDPLAEPLIAEVAGEPVAGAMMFRFANRAYYLQGMSRTAHREKMPTYLIQWEGMRWAKQAGCEVYDMWGAPDEFSREDPMWGVYRFKRGFGGEVMRTIGAWDYVSKPSLYWAYTHIWPRVLSVMRIFREQQTEQEAN